MSLPTKEELGAKLLDYPLLRQLLYERWFRLAFALFVLIFVSLGLFLPKIWRTSARGFHPVVRVSGLDMVQAWSLKRTAMKAAAAGQFNEANYSWQAALANNRADPELVRGALRNILVNPNRRKFARQGIQEAMWLLKLTGTNSLPDLELSAQILAQFRYYDAVMQLVEPRLSQATPALTATYLEALFDQGQIQLFDARWNQLSGKIPDDPRLALYRAAFLLGWGPPETMTQAREKLAAASADPRLSILACRLKLALAGHALDAAAFGQTLSQLEDAREDNLSYHVGYWRLLAATGQKAKAEEMARDFTYVPNSAVEVVELAQGYAELQMHAQALELLQRFSKDFAQIPLLWVAYANELIDTKAWDDLRSLAFQIRSQDNVRDLLAGYTYFLEGRAELALGRADNAAAAFQKATEHEFAYPVLAMKVASQLLHLNYPEVARQILLPLEKPLHADPSYWLLVFNAADQVKDVELLLRAGAHCYELNPRDLRTMNNYAAALIINRQNPEKAIQLTLELYTQAPNQLFAVVNHSAALLLNDRPKEAEALLSRVVPSQLDPAQRALYNLDLFETYFRLGQFDRAWTISDQIEPERLYPCQRQWLAKTREQLPPRPKLS